MALATGQRLSIEVVTCQMGAAQYEPSEREASMHATSKSESGAAESQLLDQASAMLKYASRKGLSVAPELVEAVTRAHAFAHGSYEFRSSAARDWRDDIAYQGVARQRDDGSPPGEQSAERVVRAFEENLQNRLVQAHNQLARLIRPAWPETVALLERERTNDANWWHFRWLGPLPTVRFFLGSSLIVLVLVIGLLAYVSANEDTQVPADPAGTQGATGVSTRLAPSLQTALATRVNLVAQAETPEESSNGGFMVDLARALALIGTAYLGATFAVLYRLRNQVLQGTYRQDDNFAYVSEIVLGLIAGYLLATVIGSAPVSGLGDDFTQPLLALLGGFSAALVYRILSQIGRGLEAVFEPDPEERISAKVEAARLKVEGELERKVERWRSEVIRARGDVVAGDGPRAVDTLDALEKDMAT